MNTSGGSNAMTKRRWGIPLLSGLVAAAITLGLTWPLMGDPFAIPLPIGAAAISGFVVGGVAYLVMNVP